jgi:CubicO group peptidase (beta-lactamase class C family)
LHFDGLNEARRHLRVWPPSPRRATVRVSESRRAVPAAPGSVGEFGWSGAAKTHYWVDPQEQMVGLFMTQSMLSFDLSELDLRALAYQAIED